jgi:hypothetical protein
MHRNRRRPQGPVATRARPPHFRSPPTTTMPRGLCPATTHCHGNRPGVPAAARLARRPMLPPGRRRRPATAALSTRRLAHSSWSRPAPGNPGAAELALASIQIILDHAKTYPPNERLLAARAVRVGSLVAGQAADVRQLQALAKGDSPRALQRADRRLRQIRELVCATTRPTPVRAFIVSPR